MLVTIALLGCETERIITSDGRPLPEKPRVAPAAPATARANEMAFIVGSKPEDTTGNGYPDLIRATVALFASPHPMAIHEDGAFVFTLFRRGQVGNPDAMPIAQWRMDQDAARRAHAIAQYGPVYQFHLSMLDAGGDAHPLTAADLRATFFPADGSAPIHSDGVRSIQIGRRAAR